MTGQRIRDLQRAAQRVDTPADISWRVRHEAARTQVQAERLVHFPVITPENFDAACDWQNARIAELMRQLAEKEH